MGKFDVDAIRRDNPIDGVAARLGIQLIKNGHEWVACCPFHSEKTASFTVFKGRDGVQRFHCMGCGEAGDVIDLVMLRTGFKLPAAAEFLGGKKDAPRTLKPIAPQTDAVDYYDGYKVLKPPRDVPPILPGQTTPPLLNPKRVDDNGQVKSVTYKPSRVFPYRDRDGRLVGYVLRVDFDGHKITPAILWMKKGDFVGWSHGSMPSPRPLYRLPEILEDPGRQVLVVEGEKNADDAAQVLGQTVVAASWLGGAKAYEKSNWTALRGRRVVLWADNDPEGENAMLGRLDKQGKWVPGLAEILLGDAGAAEVKYVEPPGAEKPKGWDISNAITDDKMTKAEILAFAKERTVTITKETLDRRRRELLALHGDIPARPADQAQAKPQPSKPTPQAIQTEQAKPEKQKTEPKPKASHDDKVISLHGDPIPAGDSDADLGNWRANLLMNADGEKVLPKASTNFYWMLAGHPETRGIFGWNEMLSCPFVIRRPPWEPGDADDWRPRRVSSGDEQYTRHFLERRRLQPGKSDAQDTITLVARRRSYNPIQMYLAAQKWDGEPRLFGGISSAGGTIEPASQTYFNSPRGDIFAAFVARWLISAVARAMRPGCKVDTMLILESGQGFNKSSALRRLATVDDHPYFVDSIGDIEDRKSILQLDTSWIAEVGELTGFDRKSTEPVKAWLSRQVDTFVPPYGRHPEDRPRKYVVAGTVNPGGAGYLKDPTGARRFWPCPVLENIDLALIERDRDQIWAEAVHHWKSGEQWWLTPAEEEAAKLITDDRFEEDPWTIQIDALASGQNKVDLQEVLRSLAIPTHMQTEFTTSRIKRILQRKGFVRGKARSDLTGKSTWMYVRKGAKEDDSDVM